MGDVAALGVMRPDPGPGILWSPIRARRCLFGPPDHVRTKDVLENETRKIEQSNKERWNFDFVQGTPLEGGRYAWTPVTREASSCKNDDASSQKDHHLDDVSGCMTTMAKKEKKLITDFMRKRKFSSNQKEKMTPEPKVKTRRRFST